MTVTAEAARAVPPVGPMPERVLPEQAERRLPSGLRVVAVRQPRVPVVELRLRVPLAGTEPGHLAITSLLADAFFTGTAFRGQVEIAASLQRLGGALSASSDADRLGIGGSVLAPEMPVLLDLLAELLTAPAYPDRELQVERARLRERLAVARSQPARIARDALLRRLHGDHPYGRELPGEDEVEAVAADALRRLHRQRVGPDGSVLVLVGDLEPERALDQAQAALVGWQPVAGRPALPPPPVAPPVPPLLVDRPGAVQTTIRLGGTAPARTDPLYPAAKLANLVFGGYFSSRLVANLRERHGYTYSPRSGIQHAAAASFLTIGADVATRVTAPALVEITYELGRMATAGVEADELDAACRYAIGSLALSTATQAGLASTLAALLMAGLDLTYLREHPRALAAVTADEVRTAALVILAPSRLQAVLVGDAAQITDDVRSVTAVATS